MNTAAVLGIKQYIKEQYVDAIEQYKTQQIRSDALLSSLCKITDQALKNLCKSVSLPATAALCAVGGYGRGELFPYSDIDLLILLQQAPTPADTLLLESFVSSLWDLGLEIGHSVRTVEECLSEAKRDVTIETALLEARFITGDRVLAQSLSQKFLAQLNPQAFYRAKILEMQQRYNRYNQTPYELEPNCKESPGGLRDIQLIEWLVKSIGFENSWKHLVSNGFMTINEAKQIKKVARSLKRLRIDLHLINKKRDDRLLFHVQPLLAQLYDFKDQSGKRASELFMQRYYRAVKLVYVITQFMLQNFKDYLFATGQPNETIIDENFRSIGQELDVRHNDAFARKSKLLLKVFLVLQQNPQLSGLTVRTQRIIWNSRFRIDKQFCANPVNNWLFLQIVQQPRGIVKTFRLMSMLDILPAYIPAFRNVTGQMQHDLFHVLTVDQHTLMVIRNIRRFAMPEFADENPLASRLITEFDRRWVLYLAALFHDIGKGRGGDHSALGAVDARAFAQQHKLNAEDADLLVFLVANHLIMSTTAQKRDISDAEVINEFCQIVKTQRRLTALYLLTVADIRGTSPKVWNAWKGKLLADLYNLSFSVLSGKQLDRETMLTQQQQQAIALIKLSGISDEQRQQFWYRMDDAYFLRHEPADIAWHTRILHAQVHTDKAIVKARPIEKQLGIQIMVFAKDHPALFETIASYFYENQINIFEAHIHTGKDGYGLDTFMVDSPRFTDNLRSFMPIIEHGLAEKLHQKQAPGALLIKKQMHFVTSPDIRRSRTFPIMPSLTLDADETNKSWRLQITTTDSPSLLYTIAHIFTKHHVNLQMARVMTLGERVEDVFIIDGPKLNNPREQLIFERDIIESLNHLVPSTH